MDVEKKPEPSTLARALARTVGLSDDSTIEDVEAHLLETLELVNMAEDDRAEALAARLARAFGADDIVVDVEPDADVEVEVEADEPESEPEPESPEMARLQAQVAQLQADKVASLFNRRIPKRDADSIRLQFNRLLEVAGFDIAYDTARSQIALLSRVTGTQGPRSTRIAQRPNRLSDKTDEKRKAMAHRLAKAAMSMGHKPKGK